MLKCWNVEITEVSTLPHSTLPHSTFPHCQRRERPGRKVPAFRF
jgi:hypothetical protein